MKLFLSTLINLSCEELNSEAENPLKYAISSQKLVYAQLLAWVSFVLVLYQVKKPFFNYFFGSGALSGKMLLVMNVENNENDDYLGQVRLSKVSLAPHG